MTISRPVYKRIMIKLSGEALMGDESSGIDARVLGRIADEIYDVTSSGVQVGVVIGGGNLFRGVQLSKSGLSRVTSDHIGMLGTLMNSLALRDVFEGRGMNTRVMSAVPLLSIVDHYDRRKALHHLQEGRVVIFAAGTGNPLVTTDSAASLRAIEIESDILLKATNVDGIYDRDPNIYDDARRYQHLSFAKALAKELKIMDLGAFCQCRDYNMPVNVFNIKRPGILHSIIFGGKEGTLVDNEEGELYAE